MGKDWEAKQVDRLVKKQKEKIASLKQKVEMEHPLPGANQPGSSPKLDPSIKRINPEDPNKPINS